MESNYKQSRHNEPPEHDDLDRTLDAALARYSSVEARAGLDQRILACLQSEQRKAPTRTWWRWSAAGAVATLLVIIAALGWKSSTPARIFVQQRRSAPIEAMPSATRAATSSRIPGAVAAKQTPKARRRHVRPSAAVVADGPKLDQFPSPEPLTAEELALVRYVREFRQDAVIVASAQQEFEKQVEQEAAAGQQSTPESIQER